MEPSWYALQVRPRYENLCEVQLANKGYEVFLPRYTTRLVSRGRAKTARVLLFPGYLFCKATDKSVGKMVITPGAIRLLGVGNRPEAVAEHEIESLRRIDESDVTRRPWQYLPGGTMVEIGSGPLSGVRGVLISEGVSRKIIVSVTLLHRSVSAELDEATLLRPVSGRQPSDWQAVTGVTDELETENAVPNPKSARTETRATAMAVRP